MLTSLGLASCAKPVEATPTVVELTVPELPAMVPLAGSTSMPCARPLDHAPAPAVALAASELHTCARLADHTLACWGRDEDAARMMSCSGEHAATPVAVELGRADAVATGMNGTCIIDGGHVRCTSGVLEGLCGGPCGAGEIAPLAGVERLAIGDYHVCGVREGRVVCVARAFERPPPVLGPLTRGRFERAAAGAHGAYARGVIPIRGATLLSAGVAFACTTDAAGAVYCWGDNPFSVLGRPRGDLIDSASPVRVGSFDGVTRLESNRVTTCALTRTGEVFCWGGDFERPERLPFADVVDVAVSDRFVCALDRAHRVRCVGETEDTLGDAPPQFDGRAVEIVAGGERLCARLAGGAVRCVGISGYLGDGGALPRPVADTPGAISVELVHEPRTALDPASGGAPGGASPGPP